MFIYKHQLIIAKAKCPTYIEDQDALAAAGLSDITLEFMEHIQ